MPDSPSLTRPIHIVKEITALQGDPQRDALKGWTMRISDGASFVNPGDVTNRAMRVNIVAGAGGGVGTEFDDGDALDTDSLGKLIFGTTGIPGTARAIRTDNDGHPQVDVLSGGGGFDAVVEKLTITSHDLYAAQFSQQITFTNDAIVNSLMLYFSPAIGAIDITLEDYDTGAQLLYYLFNDTHNSFVALDINYAIDSARSLQLIVSQASSACTLNGFILVRE